MKICSKFWTYERVAIFHPRQVWNVNWDWKICQLLKWYSIVVMCFASIQWHNLNSHTIKKTQKYNDLSTMEYRGQHQGIFCNRYQEHKSLGLVRSTWAGVVTTCLRLLKYLISVRNAYGIRISLDFVCSKRIGEQVNHAVLYAKFTQRLQNWNGCSWQSTFPGIWV